ncbi:MAG: circadian clock KaiB family protein [Sedimentisphaerales bacterium]|nr:circadian clock KaiB family protein [Sedimentisphaerales bacterium]
MPIKKKKTARPKKAASFKAAARKNDKRHYLLKLYITGMTPRSTRAIVNIKKICEEYLSGRYRLEVIDIYQHPILAKGEQIVATPTLIKKLPPPMQKVIGDMSDTERILMGLDLRPAAKRKAKRK